MKNSVLFSCVLSYWRLWQRLAYWWLSLPWALQDRDPLTIALLGRARPGPSSATLTGRCQSRWARHSAVQHYMQLGSAQSASASESGTRVWLLATTLKNSVLVESWNTLPRRPHQHSIILCELECPLTSRPRAAGGTVQQKDGRWHVSMLNISSFTSEFAPSFFDCIDLLSLDWGCVHLSSRAGPMCKDDRLTVGSWS